jgi:hypothetical protein
MDQELKEYLDTMKADIIEHTETRLDTVKAEITERFQTELHAVETHLTEDLRATETRLTERFHEDLHDTETRLLRGFADYNTAWDNRFKRIEVSDITIVERLAALENRVFKLETGTK